jgi:hypothetical protein
MAIGYWDSNAHEKHQQARLELNINHDYSYNFLS